MIGVEFDTHEHAAAAEWASFQRGVLVLEAGETVVRIAPPLVITAEEVAIGLKLFGEAVAEIASSRVALIARAVATSRRPQRAISRR